MTNKAVAFLGPTLEYSEVGLTIRPPAKNGDITRAVYEGFETIILIDGYFAHCPAVWHKEILLALARGIQVIGASSMGALRAAELHPFGMVGVGKIFDWYRSGRLNRDDAVAIAHLPTAPYFSVSDAHVNILATVDVLLDANEITAEQAKQVMDDSEATFYPLRSFAKLAKRYKLPTSNFIDQKKLDAIEALAHPREKISPTFEFVPNAFLRKLQMQVSCDEMAISRWRFHLCRLVYIVNGILHVEGRAPVGIQSMLEHCPAPQNRDKSVRMILKLLFRDAPEKEIELGVQLYRFVDARMRNLGVPGISPEIALKRFQHQMGFLRAEQYRNFLTISGYDHFRVMIAANEFYDLETIVDARQFVNLRLSLDQPLVLWHEALKKFLKENSV